MVDRCRQTREEVLQRGRVGGVEGGGLVRTDVGRRSLESIRVAPGQHDVRTLGAGTSGGLEADARRTTDANDGLPEQFGLALRLRRGRVTAHELSRSNVSTHVDTERCGTHKSHFVCLGGGDAGGGPPTELLDATRKAAEGLPWLRE